MTLSKQVYDPDDPMGRMFFNILATFAEFERPHQAAHPGGAKIARNRGKLRGKPPSIPTYSRAAAKCARDRRILGLDLGKLFAVSAFDRVSDDPATRCPDLIA